MNHVKHRTGFVPLIAAAIVASLTAATHAVIVVANPNFDPPTEDISDNPSPGYGPITSWTRSATTIGVNDASLPFLNQTAHSGTHVAFIQQGSGNISQSISGYDPTKLYTVTYWVSERGLAAGNDTGTSVSLDGGATFYTDPDPIIKTDKFRRIVSGPLAVSSSTSTLQINAANGTGDDALLIDTVSITRAVPTVPDGGFENPVQPNTSTSTRYKLGSGSGSGTLVGSAWDFGTTASGITRNGSAFAPPAAPEGMQAAILRGTTQFSTTVSGFEAGVTYSISFEAAGRSGGLGPTEFQVLLDGVALEFGGNTDLTPTVGSYQSFTSDGFTTLGGAFTLAFQGLTGGDKTTFIDDVRFNFVAEAPVVVIPAPAALPAGLAILGLLAARRRR